MLILSHHCHQPPLSSFRALKAHRCSSFLPKLHFLSRLQRFSVELQIAHGCFPLPRSSNLLFQFHPRVSIGEAGKCADRELGDENSDLADFEDLGDDSEVFKKTLQLVECAMFASVAGLAYFLSNSLAVENYFSCFFSLPIVISSIRWGISAGRKTTVATVMLLFTLSGPVKASTYLLLHGLVGLAMGTLWRLRFNWATSILLCTLIRATGAVGYVLLSSFLIRENILALITINIHASLTFIFTAMGINIIPSMNVIYLIFGSLLLLNCGFFVFLLHILYSIFLSKLGLKDSLTLPAWMAKAI